MTRARREQTMIVSKKPRSLVPCLWISPTHTHRRLGVGGEKTREIHVKNVFVAALDKRVDNDKKFLGDIIYQPNALP